MSVVWVNENVIWMTKAVKKTRRMGGNQDDFEGTDGMAGLIRWVVSVGGEVDLGVMMTMRKCLSRSSQ